jgi:hypothetical protein
MHFLGGSLFFIALALISCALIGSPDMIKTARFDDAISVTCKLDMAPLPQRIAAAKELLLGLDASEDIVATALFEDGRVVVNVTLGGGTERWRVDFHLVWPEPQLNNQHLSILKLVNWSASAPPNAVLNQRTAKIARTKAETQLRKVIHNMTTDGGPLEGRITLIEAPEG